MTVIIETVNAALAWAGEGPSIVDAAAHISRVIERVKIMHEKRIDLITVTRYSCSVTGLQCGPVHDWAAPGPSPRLGQCEWCYCDASAFRFRVMVTGLEHSGYVIKLPD